MRSRTLMHWSTASDNKMARQHHSGRWEARRTIKTAIGPKRVSGWGSSPEEAQADLESIIAAEQLVIPVTSTLSSFTRTVYLPTVREKSARWREQIDWALGHILPALGHLPLVDVSRQVLQQFITAKGKGARKLGRTSLGHLLKVIHAILELAVADDLIPKNPAKYVTLPSVPTRRKEILTPSDIAQLIEKSRGHDVAVAIIYLCGLCGCRIAEASSVDKIARDDVLEISGTKTAASVRDIPLPKEVAGVLRAIELPISPHRSNANDRMKRAAIRAGIKKPCNPHSLRHAFATGLQRLGCPEDVRARLLGHGKRGITAHYSHAELSTWRSWMEAWYSEVYQYIGGNAGGEKETSDQSTA